MNPLTTALVAMRRSPYQTLAAVLMVSLTFFVGYIFSLFLIGTERVLVYFETRPQIIAFFQLDTDPASIAQLEAEMGSRPYVEKVKVVSKEDALKMYQNDNKDDPLLLELVTSAILPASMEVSGKQVKDLAQIKKDLENQTQVDEVIYQQDVIDSLTSWTTAARVAGMGSILILGITSFLIVLIIIGMKVTTKKAMIQIMRIIGATRWYITLPYMYEGLLYGLIGSIIGWSSMYILLLYLTPWIQNFLGGIQLLPVPLEVLAIQLSVGTLGGMFLGAFTGALAVRRMIRR